MGPLLTGFLSDWGWQWVFAMLITADVLSALVCLHIVLSFDLRSASGSGSGPRRSSSPLTSPLTELKKRFAPLRIPFMSLPRLVRLSLLVLSATVAFFILFLALYAFRGSAHQVGAMGHQLAARNNAYKFHNLYSSNAISSTRILAAEQP